jgi:hypothetical protein
MTLGRPHLCVALGLLIASLFYVTLSFVAAPQAQRARRHITGQDQPFAPAAGHLEGSTVAGPDLTAIPAPPDVDLGRPPSWAGNPFRSERDRSGPPAPEVARAPDPDPVVGSILFSDNRRLAVVEGRIVGVGDRIGSLEVIEIDRDALVVQTPSGERRRIDLRPRRRVEAPS